MKRYLIVYYSRTGITAQVAGALARACGADLEQIHDTRPRAGFGGYLRSAWEALRQMPGDIVPPQHRPADYPFVVLGTPVWAGQISAPMRSYILQQRGHFRRVGLFCTMGGSGGQRVLDAMADLCNKLPVASLALRQSDVLAGGHITALAGFAKELEQLQRNDEETVAPDAQPRRT